MDFMSDPSRTHIVLFAIRMEPHVEPKLQTHQAGEPRTTSPDSRRVLALAEGESPAPTFAEMSHSEAKSMRWTHRYATMLYCTNMGKKNSLGDQDLI